MEIVKYIGEADGKRALVAALGLEDLEVRREEYAAMSGLGQGDPLIVELYVRKLTSSHLSDREISTAIKRIVADVSTLFPESSITSRPLASDLS
jgi:hypothetical protein